MGTKVNFLGYSLAVDPFPVTTDTIRPITINTINQYSYCVAQQDGAFKKALQASDILLPDGMAIVKAYAYLTGKPLKKIAGADMHSYLLEQLSQTDGRCFYLGSTPDVLARIKDRMEAEYPTIKTQYHSPPFREDFSEDDLAAMIDDINSFRPDVLFLGLTAPKQEKLAYMLKERVQTKIICSVGAVFDFYAGSISRPSQFWINLNLEWFVRLMKEPKRMWKRYLYYGTLFIYDIVLTKVKRADLIRTAN